MINYFLALIICGILIFTYLYKPKASILATFVVLAFLGIIRRSLNYYFDVPDLDPLLLIGPVMAVVYLIVPNKEQMTTDKHDSMHRIMVLLVLLMLLQIFNPVQGGLMVGLIGAFFYLAPIIWFWVGRRFGDVYLFEKIITKLIPTLAIIAAVWGVIQVAYGFLPADLKWIESIDYNALYVYGVIRPFGFLTSSQEYGALISSALIIIFALPKQKWYSYIFLTLLFISIILLSSKGVLVFVIFSIICLILIKVQTEFRQKLQMLFGILLFSLLIYFGTLFSGGALFWGDKISSLTQHLFEVLKDPFNPEISTIPIHWGMLKTAIISSTENIFGLGLGSTANTAKIGQESIGLGAPENDLRLVVSMGFIGLIAYIVIVYEVFRNLIRAYRFSGDVLLYSVLAILLVNIIQWFNGALYLMSPLIWFIIGSATQMEKIYQGKLIKKSDEA